MRGRYVRNIKRDMSLKSSCPIYKVSIIPEKSQQLFVVVFFFKIFNFSCNSVGLFLCFNLVFFLFTCGCKNINKKKLLLLVYNNNKTLLTYFFAFLALPQMIFLYTLTFFLVRVFLLLFLRLLFLNKTLSSCSWRHITLI